MNVQIDEMTMVLAVVSASATTVGLILGGGWMLLSSFRKDMIDRMAQSDHGLQERQDAFMRLMSQHIASEDRQFAAIAQAQAEMQRKIDSFQRDYVTREYLEGKLLPIRADTAQTKRIVDSRQHAGIDPVSGRPPEVERRRTKADEEAG
ncbi:MAG: hypothetical protein V9G98_10295 [Candidatus Competibacter sp.]